MKRPIACAAVQPANPGASWYESTSWPQDENTSWSLSQEPLCRGLCRTPCRKICEIRQSVRLSELHFIDLADRCYSRRCPATRLGSRVEGKDERADRGSPIGSLTFRKSARMPTTRRGGHSRGSA